MKPDVEMVSVQSNFNGLSRKVTIDKEAIGHIMDSLSGLYSNIFRALIRELSTNARDSHIMAGTDRPIEVNLPTRFNNELVIRDYGIGLSVDDIFDMYTYGKSSKRLSNDYNGIMGFGSKSPWAYTHTFSLAAVKDGIKTLALLTKDADGVGNVQILDTSATTDPNGVQISIPVKVGDEYQFEREATYIFTYWPQDAVLINGKPPRAFNYKFKITDNIFLVQETGGNDIVVMGGVPYVVRGENKLFQRDNMYRNYSAVVFAENGDIRFTPSREAIKYNHTKTIDKLNFWHEEIKSKFAEKINQEIDACETYSSAAKKAQGYSGFGLKLQYRGIDIPDGVMATYMHYDSVKYDKHVGLHYQRDGIVIVNFNGKKISKQQRMKIEKHTGAYQAIFVAVDDAKWFDDLPLYDWSDIVKEKLNLPKTTKSDHAWGVLRYGGVEEVTDLNPNVVYVEVDNKPRQDALRNWHAADCDIVVLRKKYADQFKKLYPNAVSVYEYAKAERKTYEDKAQTTFTYSYSDYTLLRKLSVDDVLDPEIKGHITAVHAMQSEPNYYNNRIKIPQWITDLAGYSYNLDMAVAEPFENYPLARNIDGFISDVLLYINSKYNTTNKGI